MPLHIVTAEDFVASREEDVSWLLKPFLVRGSSLMLYGRQGIGKSSLIAQLSHSFITGEPWMGFPVEQTGPVIWLQLDMAVEEARRVIERAEAAGMNYGGKLYTTAPDPELGAQVAPFDIYDPKDEQALHDWVNEIKPAAVVLDTTDDGYEAPKFKGVTEVAREVVKKYRRACHGSAFIFLRHERKPPAYRRKDEDGDDADAYSGPKDWEAVATSSIQLARAGGDFVLRFRKHRLDKPPMQQLIMQKDELGFFRTAKVPFQLALQYWPGCVPLAERQAVLEGTKSLNDVFRDVADRSGQGFDAVKQAFYRARGAGVEFPWAAMLNGEGGNSGDKTTLIHI